jgi:hypothetical protein
VLPAVGSARACVGGLVSLGWGLHLGLISTVVEGCLQGGSSAGGARAVLRGSLTLTRSREHLQDCVVDHSNHTYPGLSPSRVLVAVLSAQPPKRSL